MDDERLDDLLGAWADARRLGAARAAAIERAIVATPRELDHGWWAAFSHEVDRAMVRASALPGPARTAMDRALGMAWG